MSFLFPTRSITSTRVIDVPLQIALNTLQDAPTMVQLAPAIAVCCPSPTDPNLYIVTHKLTMFCFSFDINYTIKFRLVPDGFDSVVSAGFGTILKDSWRAKTAHGGTEVTESNTVRTFFPFTAFVLRTLRQAHFQLMDNLIAKLEGRNPCPTSRSLSDVRPSISSTSIASAFLVLLSGIIYGLRTYHLELGYALSISAFTVLSSIFIMFRKSRDPYGSFHLSLNRLPGDTSNTEPNTEWLNMGFWKDRDIFPQACEALAFKLIDAAQYQDGDKVLDVGHGSGESLIFQLSHPSVPRPSSLTGITSLHSHHQRSLSRVTRLQQCLPDLNTRIMLYHGDAVYRQNAVQHPLDPHSGLPPYDRILALDCAYHFKTRLMFLQQSFARLSPDGRVALADICFSPSSSDRWGTRVLLSLLNPMPKENFVTVDQYLRDMQRIGYVDITVEDVTEQVFPGFQRFLKSRGGLWRVFGTVIGCFASAGARFIIISGGKPELELKNENL